MKPDHLDFFYRSAGVSDVGSVRKVNEDSFVVRDEVGLWAVADGVGGHDAGDVASSMIAAGLAKIQPPTSGGLSFINAARGVLHDANRAMRDYAEARGSERSMGSTVVALLALRDYVACLWVGDSRAYRLREGKLTRLSRDHSLVQQLIDAGQLTEEGSRVHPQRNVVTRAVGASESLVIDVAKSQGLPGDRYLLCSDGVTASLDDSALAEALSQHDPPDVTSSVLVREAIASGSRDNVTAVVIDG